MRLSCMYNMEGVLPLDYRPGFMSLLKKGVGESNPIGFGILETRSGK